MTPPGCSFALASARPVCALVLAGWLALLVACAAPAREADRLERAGEHERAYALLLAASTSEPADADLRTALLRQKELTIRALVARVDLARASQQNDVARAAYERLAAIDAGHPRVAALGAELERSARQAIILGEARRALAAGRVEEAASLVRQVLAEAPEQSEARQLATALSERNKSASAARPLPSATLGPTFQKPVALEFRDAPLRVVMEALARTSAVNFVFDKDVRVDAKISISLKDVSVDDALKVILATQQLDRKVLNDSTLFVYPNTQAKQREHQELQTRSFYLSNADVKQAQTLVRTMAKSRDMFIDERLNLLVVRDTPETLLQVERLIASLDLPEPEVMLEVEVLEIASDRLDEAGVQWPSQAAYGITGAAGSVEISQRGDFRVSIANPALLATLRTTTSRSNVLANPRLRARNHEKAKILIGEKLPVFTTTSTANVGVSSSVSYLDVGLKLDVEPSVQLDNDVIMKVNLEVSSLIARVPGPQGSVAYQIGTRQASTSLRLRSGETQVLAGLIRDEERKNIYGVPLLADLPLLGRLFGLHADQSVKTEVVLLITPRVVRNIQVPDLASAQQPSGVDANPAAQPLRLARAARVAVQAPGAAPAALTRLATSSAGVLIPVGEAPSGEAGDASAALVLSTSAQVKVGETAAVTLKNRSAAVLKGELQFEATQMQSAQGGERDGGRVAFTLAPGGEQVFLLRALPASVGQVVRIGLVSLQATLGDGRSLDVRVEGDGQITVATP